jgi:hypothetical protein
MTYAYGNLVSDSNPASSKKAVPGVQAYRDGNVEPLLKTLARLGLCDSRYIEPLTAIAAAGQSMKDSFQINVWDLDAKLKDAHCTFEQRIGFKRSLERAGLLADMPK